MSFNEQYPQASKNGVTLNSEAKEFIPNATLPLSRSNTLNPGDPRNQDKENLSKKNTGAVRKRFDKREHPQSDFRDPGQQSGSSRKFYNDSNENYYRSDRNGRHEEPTDRVRRDPKGQHPRNDYYAESAGN